MVNALAELFDDLAVEAQPSDRWRVLTDTLGGLGLTEINYSFLDMATASRMDCRGDPVMSTMRADWLEYYVEHLYDLDDYAVSHVRAGRMSPMMWSAEDAPRTDAPHIINEAADAGLRTGLLVPLAGPAGSALPGAGIMLGSSLGETEFRRMLRENGMDLVALAHLFHAGAVGELIRRRHQVAPLSPRERDCLQFIAAGLRPDTIADRLTLAKVTVDMHLTNARKKLGCRTMAETVARAIQYQQISVG